MPWIQERLNRVRQQQVIGRHDEQHMFMDAITARELPFCVLHLWGPGGIGKTTLLRAFAAICQQQGVAWTYVDARDIEPSPDRFLHALNRALHTDPSDPPMNALLAIEQRHVIVIDTYERLAALDDWLRDSLLPALPDQVLIVLSGRQPPTLPWRTDPGWHTLIRTMPLRNLSTDDSRTFLHRRDVPPDQIERVIDFTHGHPLALSLVADVFAQREDFHFQPEAVPDVIKALLEEFVQQVPGPAHRAALEACALVRLMTETLLAQLLGMPDVHELFEWLRSLSFIEAGPRGVFPHDLAREALVADLRWRTPDWYAELHRRARNYYAAALQGQQGIAQQRVLFDYIFLHRDNPLMRPYFEWRESGSGLPSGVEERDRATLIAMVAQHEGAESAAIAAHWLKRQPEHVLVFRDTAREPSGFVAWIELQAADPADRAVDPAAKAAWHLLDQHAPLRPGERSALFRFWMARDTYQAVSAIQSLIFITITQYSLTTPGLAYNFFACADPTFWQPALAYADLHRLPAADFTVGGRRYAMHGHDWRTVPPLAWLDLLAERELASEPIAPQPAATPTMVVLSQSDFEQATRSALQHLTRADALRSNPLIRSRLVIDHAGLHASDSARVAELQALIKRAVESLQSDPHVAKEYRALYHTYLQPAPTQERAAEILDVPFSSYRRHLKAGLIHVATILWQWELDGHE